MCFFVVVFVGKGKPVPLLFHHPASSHNTFLNTIYPLYLMSIDDSYLEKTIVNVEAKWWFSNLIISSMLISCILLQDGTSLTPPCIYFFTDLFTSSETHEFLFILWVVTHYWCYSFWSSNYPHLAIESPCQLASVSQWFNEHFLLSSSEKFPWSFNVLAPALESAIFLSHLYSW